MVILRSPYKFVYKCLGGDLEFCVLRSKNYYKKNITINSSFKKNGFIRKSHIKIVKMK